MTIELMKERHLDSLARLEALCFSQPWSRQALEDELANENARFFVCAQGGEVLGYGGMHFVLDEFYMDNLAVFPQHRGRGVGKAILFALVGFAQSRGARFLTLEVRPSNTPALALYESAGFAPAGRRKNFYAHPQEDALILTKDLAQPPGEKSKKNG